MLLNLTVSTSTIKIKQSYYISGYKIQYVSVKLEKKLTQGSPLMGFYFWKCVLHAALAHLQQQKKK